TKEALLWLGRAAKHGSAAASTEMSVALEMQAGTLTRPTSTALISIKTTLGGAIHSGIGTSLQSGSPEVLPPAP
ncbi:MAG TPA: hypothetical protein VE866_18465, partial [Candidatus Binatia bacterium]|nr:hypothetical protein [Candidatus Binatia bacterium]